MSILVHLRIIYGIAYLESRWLKRQPTWILQSILSYIGFAVLLYAWGGLEGLRNLVVAMVIAGFWGTGVNIVAQSTGWNRVSRIQDMFIASPLGPLHYILGIFIFTSSLVFPLATMTAMLSIVGLVNAWRILLWSLAIGLPVLLVGIAIGLYVVMRIEKPVNVSAITNPISWLLVILPPVYYPSTILPGNLRPLSLIPPTSAAAEIVRQITGLTPATSTWWYPVMVLVAWASIGVILLSKTVKWGLQ